MKQEEFFKHLTNYGFQYPAFVKYNNYIGFNYMNNGRATAFYHIPSGKTLVTDIKTDSLNIIFSHLVYECNGKLIMAADLNKIAPFLQRNAQLVESRFPALHNQLSSLDSFKNTALLTFTLKEM
ncbi:hypothetical protein [Paraflavitalea speifideaquila]|uniref:hypothetical protein n=1 Tax=Paraflavitalea speifideaquila TaxID=3076558 RepID=UPI0028E52762|nr:hypothetical protein [Paraflavitalea speifideiaquila]